MPEISQVEAMMTKHMNHSQQTTAEQVKVSMEEARKTASVELQTQAMQELRAKKNTLRKQMDDTIADAMKILKSSGEKIRSPG